MSKDEKLGEDILKSVNQQGFNLEFEVYSKLLQLKRSQADIFRVQEVDISRLYQSGEEELELDVFASFNFASQDYGSGAFYIECKSSSSDTKLFLVDAPPLVYKPTIESSDNRCRLILKANNQFTGSTHSVDIIRDRHYCETTYDKPNPFFAINGNFFIEDQNKNSETKFKPTNASKNNLYKGISQLENIVLHLEKKGFASDITHDGKYKGNLSIFPILVVKSDIYVIRYDPSELQDLVYGPVPWAGYRSKLLRNSVNIENSTQIYGKSPVYFPIVNVNHFENFLTQVSHKYAYSDEITEFSIS